MNKPDYGYTVKEFVDQKPYGRDYIFVLAVGVYAGFANYILCITSQFSVRLDLLFVVSIIISVVVGLGTLWINIPSEERPYCSLRSIYLGSVLLIYPLGYGVSISVSTAEIFLMESFATPTFLISVLQALLLAWFVSMASEPIELRGIDDIPEENLFEYYKVAIDSIYKSINFVFSAIIAFAIGIVVTYTLDSSAASSPRLLSYNIISTFPLPFVIGLYLSKKHSHIMSEMRQELKN